MYIQHLEALKAQLPDPRPWESTEESLETTVLLGFWEVQVDRRGVKPQSATATAYSQTD